MEERQTEKSKNKSKIIFFASLAVLLACVCVLVWYLRGGYMSQSDHDAFVNSNVESSDVQSTQSVELVDNPINFNELQSKNTDIYAWIKIPNTNIDYPVAQSEDDTFYLDHNIYKNYEFAGTIYSENQNSKNFTDPNTVLYGHNMKNGSMFQNLHKFRDKTFFDENKYIYIYTPGHIITYEIFSAYRYDNRHILNSFNFFDREVFTEYLEFATNPKSMIVNVRNDVNVTANDRIITLSTCINDSNYRYLVQGVLISDELTK